MNFVLEMIKYHVTLGGESSYNFIVAENFNYFMYWMWKTCRCVGIQHSDSVRLLLTDRTTSKSDGECLFFKKRVVAKMLYDASYGRGGWLNTSKYRHMGERVYNWSKKFVWYL